MRRKDNKKIEEKFLPIGTVVLLKNAKKRLMITGFCARTSEDINKEWDYNGCFYPEGTIVSNQTFVFDHEQIEKVYHYGLIDEEEVFKKSIK